MKFCEDHWTKLRTAIDERGMTKLVSKSGEEAARRTTEGGFDPLMGAHNSIVSNALERAGLELMNANPDGSERCPMCFLGSHCENCAVIVETWIGKAADGALEEATSLGLLKES